MEIYEYDENWTTDSFEFQEVWNTGYEVYQGKKDISVNSLKVGKPIYTDSQLRKHLLKLPGINHYFINDVPYKFQPGNFNYELTYSLQAITEYLEQTALLHNCASEKSIREKLNFSYDLFSRHEEELAALGIIVQVVVVPLASIAVEIDQQGVHGEPLQEALHVEDGLELLGEVGLLGMVEHTDELDEMAVVRLILVGLELKSL